MRAWRLLACTLLALLQSAPSHNSRSWSIGRPSVFTIASRCGGLIAVKAPQCSAALQVDMLLRGIL